MISYQSGDTLAFYTYDAEDYRITKQVMNSDGEKFTRYFYEGNHVVLEADESGKITAHNTYSINLIGRTVGEEGYYYFYNAHGDVVKLIGIQSEEEILYRYDAFGTLVEVTGDADNSITYAGYQYDKESGLYYLNARYYDSTTARFLTEDTYAGKANDPLSLHRYTYCANNPLRYTDPDGHFFGALFRFVAGAVVGAVTEYVTQKFIEKRDKINVKAIVYEGVVGGVTSVIGGVGGAAKKAEKTVKAVKSAKTVVKSAVKTGAKEAASGFIEDVGYQVFAEDKSLADVDYGQAIKAGADSGISAMVGELDDAFGSKKQLSATNRKKASQATGLIDDAADAPRPRTNALPDVEVTPSRGAVKNVAGGLADAGVGTGNVGRKTGTLIGNTSSKKGSSSLSKNQKKIQSQTVGSTLSGNITATKESFVSINTSKTLKWETVTPFDTLDNRMKGNLLLENGRKKARAKQIRQYKGEMRRKGINVVVDKKSKMIPPKMAAGFDRSTKTIYIRKNAGVLDLYHEARHVEQFLNIGLEEYESIGSLAREEYVYAQIMKNSHLFNDEEIKLSQDYINDLRRNLK